MAAPQALPHRYLYQSRTLRDYFERRRWKEADLRFLIYRGPVSRRYHRVSSLCSQDQEHVVSSAVGGLTFAPGTVVPVGNSSGGQADFILGGPPPGAEGAAFSPVQTATLAFEESCGITSADPEEVEVGAVGSSHTLTGYGFLSDPADQIKAVLWNETLGVWVLDPKVTVTSVVVNSSTEAVITVDVDATAGIRAINLWCDRAGAPLPPEAP